MLSAGAPDASDESAAAAEREPPIATVRSGPADGAHGVDGTEGRSGPESASTRSVVGAVMGTPAYRSPEQARGEVQLVDERSDVFALGAVLCTLLTGAPPYLGERVAVLFKASQVHLAEAFERLDASGADPELVGLARECLAEARHARPRTAEVVAARIHAYLTSVEERAHAAQLAAAEARVREEPKALAALIDEWAHVRRLLGGESEAAPLIALLNQLDSEPRRVALREAMGRRDLDALREFVDTERFEALSAPTLRLVADAMEVAGDRPRQLDVLRRAQKLHRQDFLTNLRLARMLVRAGQIEEALPYYEVTLALRPENIEARHLFGIYLHRFADRVEDAQELFRQSVQLSPEDAHLWYHVGQAELTRGRIEGALAALEESVRLDPNYLEAHGSLGEARVLAGDFAGAERALRRA